MNLEHAYECSEIGGENLEQKFSQLRTCTCTLAYNMMRIFHLEILELDASPEEGQQLQENNKERQKKKTKVKKIKLKKPKDAHVCGSLSHF